VWGDTSREVESGQGQHFHKGVETHGANDWDIYGLADDEEDELGEWTWLCHARSRDVLYRVPKNHRQRGAGDNGDRRVR